MEMKTAIQEARVLSKIVREEVTQRRDAHNDIPIISLTEANSRLIELGFGASPSGMDMDYYRNIANTDPILA